MVVIEPQQVKQSYSNVLPQSKYQIVQYGDTEVLLNQPVRFTYY